MLEEINSNTKIEDRKYSTFHGTLMKMKIDEDNEPENTIIVEDMSAKWNPVSQPNSGHLDLFFNFRGFGKFYAERHFTGFATR